MVLSDADTTQHSTMLRNIGADSVMGKSIGLDGFLRAVKALDPEWLEMRRVGRPAGIGLED